MTATAPMAPRALSRVGPAALDAVDDEAAAVTVEAAAEVAVVEAPLLTGATEPVEGVG